MHRFIRKSMVVLLAISLLIVPLGVSAEMDAAMGGNKDADAGKMAADVFVLRPLGFVSTIFGCAVYVVALPFSLPGGNHNEVFETTIAEPAKFTFKRGVGDF